MNLSENLKQIRKDNDLSQEALAEMLGVSRQSVSKWESGTAYPEMDKVLQICKLFNVNLDDLMHEDIKLAKEKKESKNSINKFVDDLLSYITKSINMFSTLSFKSKLLCLFEQAGIILILCLIATIIGSLLGEVLSSIFMYVPVQITNFIKGLFGSIYGIAVFILIMIIWLHIFKSRYLDYYKFESKEDADIKEEIEEENNQTISDIKKAPKIIIRDKTTEENGFFKALFKVCLIFIKTLVLFISLAFIFCVIAFGILLSLSFIFAKQTLFFWGAIITLISLIIINLVFLKFIYDFIFSRKTRKGFAGILLGVSLLTTGIGIGVFSIDVFKLDYIKDIPNNEVLTKTINIPIIDSVKYIDIFPCNHNSGIKCKFIEKEGNEINVEIEYSKYTDVKVYSNLENYNVENDNYQWIDIYYYIDEEKISDYVSKVIKDINSYKVYDICPNKVTIYAPKIVLNKITSDNQDI